MSTCMYGINNCDTIRKAKKWLTAADVQFTFHDVRKDGLTAEKLNDWCDAVGWETLLNKRGTTWRQLPDDIKSSVDETSAKAIMLQSPAIIKRPVLETGGRVIVGFNAAEYESLFS
ncbi:MAG: ArsC family reductase [Gammaproteobacteria bacterium]|nr:MAG: ArsC family reductase [Gammaproteobacteria bacterium]